MYFSLWSILLFTAFILICVNIIFTLRKKLSEFSGISDIQAEIQKLKSEFEQKKAEQVIQFQNMIEENQALAKKELESLDLEKTKIEQESANKIDEMNQQVVFIVNKLKNTVNLIESEIENKKLTLYETNIKIENSKIDLISMNKEEFILSPTNKCSKQFVDTMSNHKIRINKLIKQKTAWNFRYGVSYEDVQFNSMSMLNVFDSICEFTISRIKTTNIVRLEMIINSAFHNLNMVSDDISISPEYRDVKIEEMALYSNYINKGVVSFERC